MTERWIELRQAHRALRAAVAAITPEDLARATPCACWTVAQVIEHAVLDQGVWAHAVGGPAPPRRDPFAPTGAVPAEVAEYVDTELTVARASWSALPVEVGEIRSPLPQGNLDPVTAAHAAALDAAVHAWDIALAVGQRTPLTDELAAELLPTARSLVEPLRQWGAYGPVLPADSSDRSAAELLRYLGRDPRWSAGVRS
jgi:uncharacterized protein (TIGR03086 family)